MSISSIGSGSGPLTPVSLPQDNEAIEKVPDNETAEISRQASLKEGTGTKIDISA